MGNNPANLLAVDSRTGIITLRNKITRDQYNMLNGKYEGTILSIDGKRSIYFFLSKKFIYIYMYIYICVYSEIKILITVFGSNVFSDKIIILGIIKSNFY